MSEILKLVEKHDKYRAGTLNLQASENVLSPDVRKAMASDLGSRYSLVLNDHDAYGGTRYTQEILEKTMELTAKVYRAKYAEVRPTGGHIASQVILLSLMQRKRNLLSIPEKYGGYTGYQNGYLPQMFGVQNYDIPYNQETQEVDLEKTEKAMKSSNPALMVLGQSYFLKHYELKPLRELCDKYDCTLAYDGSHVMGLIAGGAFQQDALNYCDVLFGSTHKTFFGPQGGIILSNDEDLMNRFRKNLTWRTMDNFHPSRVAALGIAMEEMSNHGSEYAHWVVKNSRSLGKLLSEGDVKPLYGPWYSETHQLGLSQKSLEKKNLNFRKFSELLEKNRIVIDREGRVGTAEVTRMGVTNMEKVADFMNRAFAGEDVSREVGDYVSGLIISYWGEPE